MENNTLAILIFHNIMISKVILVLLAVALAQGSQSCHQCHNCPIVNNYESYMIIYGRRFGLEDNNYRKNIFFSNQTAISAHNRDPDATYKMGINQFTGLTQ